MYRLIASRTCQACGCSWADHRGLDAAGRCGRCACRAFHDPIKPVFGAESAASRSRRRSKRRLERS